METPPDPFRDLAERLLVIEAAPEKPGRQGAMAVDRVLGKLQTALTRFAGQDGFASLLRRALVLAQSQYPSLAKATLKPDGTLQGLAKPRGESAGGAAVEAVAVVAHLLSLLVTFIGVPLTLRLVREGWPDESFTL